MTPNEHERQQGVVQSAVDVLQDSVRSLTKLVTRTSSAGARALLPDTALAETHRMLASFRAVVEQAPQLTDEIEVLMTELHAKRLTIQAVATELDALDQQLELLERTLAPVQSWNLRWQHLQRNLLHLELPAGPPDT